MGWASTSSIKDTATRMALQKFADKLDQDKAQTWAGLTLSNLTASQLIQTDGSKALASVADLTAFISGTANQISVTDNVGSVTLAITDPFDIPGKLTAGSFGSPLDVTATREYGFELHYSGNDYDVTGIRSRANLITTADSSTRTACGALLQAANSDGISVNVLNGALIEAIGKSTANAATISTMRGALINTEWSAKDTITDLRILHVRTHTRDNATEGYFSNSGYGLYIENEAVGGNGQALTAGIYFKGTNLSAGNKAFTYGIDFSGGTYGTAEIRFSNGETIDNLTDGQLDITGDLVVSGTVTAEQITSTDDITAGDSFFGSLGVAASPTYAFTADTRTGMYLSSTGKLVFSADGVDRLTLYSNIEALFAVPVRILLSPAGSLNLTYNSITSTTGAISFGDDNLTTTGRGIFGSADTLGIDLSNITESTPGNVTPMLKLSDKVCGSSETGGPFVSGFSVIHAGGTQKEFFNLFSDSVSTTVFGGGIDGEAFRRFRMLANGQLCWGSGSAAADFLLKRLAAGMQFESATPYFIFYNPTEENTAGGRESQFLHKGEKDDGTAHTLVKREASHDGAADDYGGKYVISTHTKAIGGGVDVVTDVIKVDSTQTTYIGDLGGANQTVVETDGTIRFDGAATVFEDLVIYLSSARVPASNAPTWAAFIGNLNAYTYGLNDFQEFSTEIKHSYKSGSTIEFHVHGAVNGSDVDNRIIRFEIEYTIADIPAEDGFGDVYPATTTIFAELTIPAGTTDLTGFSIDIGDDTTGNFVQGAVIEARVRRRASTGTEPTSDPFLTQVGVHIESDTVGSRTATSK